MTVSCTEILAKTNCKSMEAMVTQHQLSWLGHVIRISWECLLWKILYGKIHLGRRSAGGGQLKTWLRKCNIKPTDMEDAAADRSTWWQLCQSGVQRWERSIKRRHKQLRRHATMPAPANTDCICPTSNKACGSLIGLYSHQRIHR